MINLQCINNRVNAFPEKAGVGLSRYKKTEQIGCFLYNQPTRLFTNLFSFKCLASKISVFLPSVTRFYAFTGQLTRIYLKNHRSGLPKRWVLRLYRTTTGSYSTKKGEFITMLSKDPVA